MSDMGFSINCMHKKKREETHPKLGSECIKDTCLHQRAPGRLRRSAPGQTRSARRLQHTNNNQTNTKINTTIIGLNVRRERQLRRSAKRVGEESVGEIQF